MLMIAARIPLALDNIQVIKGCRSRIVDSRTCSCRPVFIAITTGVSCAELAGRISFLPFKHFSKTRMLRVGSRALSPGTRTVVQSGPKSDYWL
jgi:hypothetical protein